MFVDTHRRFLGYEPHKKLPDMDKSIMYRSLVALVKEGYPLDDALQDKAVQFLKRIEPKSSPFAPPTNLVNILVPSSAGSPSGFVESVVILLASPHSPVVAAAMSFLINTIHASSTAIRLRLVASDLIAGVLAAVQPLTLPTSGNEKIINNLITIITHFAFLAFPSTLRTLTITTAEDKFNHCEMIFQKVVIPSSQFVRFLISKRNILYGDLSYSYMKLLSSLFRIGPFHRPTLEFVFLTPIVITFSNCLSIVEDSACLCITLNNINDSLTEWKAEGPEVAQSGKQMMQALFSEGFEDTLEQISMYEKDSYNGIKIVGYCHTLSQLLGSNVKRQ